MSGLPPPCDLGFHADAGRFALPAARFAADRVRSDPSGLLGPDGATSVTASRKVAMTFAVLSDRC